MKQSILFILSAMIIVMVSGCSTTSGAGKDIQSVGKAITNTAEDAKK